MQPKGKRTTSTQILNLPDLSLIDVNSSDALDGENNQEDVDTIKIHRHTSENVRLSLVEIIKSYGLGWILNTQSSRLMDIFMAGDSASNNIGAINFGEYRGRLI